MPDSEIVYPLAWVTLLLVIAFAVYQVFRVRRAQKRNERSAMTDDAPANRTRPNRR